jgi:hypothetical protein
MTGFSLRKCGTPLRSENIATYICGLPALQHMQPQHALNFLLTALAELTKQI